MTPPTGARAVHYWRSQPVSQEDIAGRLVHYVICNHAKQRNDVALGQEYRVMGAQSASGGDV